MTKFPALDVAPPRHLETGDAMDQFRMGDKTGAADRVKGTLPAIAPAFSLWSF